MLSIDGNQDDSASGLSSPLSDAQGSSVSQDEYAWLRGVSWLQCGVAFAVSVLGPKQVDPSGVEPCSPQACRMNDDLFEDGGDTFAALCERELTPPL